MFFDEHCKLCLAFKKMIDYFDSKKTILWIGLNETDFSEDFKEFPEITKDLSTVIYVTHFKATQPYYLSCTKKSDAIINVICQLGFPYYSIRIAKIIPTSIRDYFYDIIGCNKYKWFGKIQKNE